MLHPGSKSGSQNFEVRAVRIVPHTLCLSLVALVLHEMKHIDIFTICRRDFRDTLSGKEQTADHPAKFDQLRLGQIAAEHGILDVIQIFPDQFLELRQTEINILPELRFDSRVIFRQFG